MHRKLYAIPARRLLWLLPLLLSCNPPTGSQGQEDAAAELASRTNPGLEQDTSAARQLYTRFLAEFAENVERCYTDYRLQKDPAVPDGPETVQGMWNRVIIAVDASGSMAAKVGNTVKMQAAKEAILEFAQHVPKDAELGLLAFGHRGNNSGTGKAESCGAVELIYQASKPDLGAISTALDGIQATGWTPLAAAISKAGASFQPRAGMGEQVVFVVSDGLETCGGDPVAAARALHESEVHAIVNIIGFDIAAEDRRALEAVAAAGGGTFSAASDAATLRERLRVDYANLLKQTAYDTLAVRRKTDNNTAALEASNKASTCVLEAIQRESKQFSEFSARLRNEDSLSSKTIRQARKFLHQRHDSLRNEIHAYRDQVRAEMNAINESIQKNRDSVDAQYNVRE